MTINQLQQFFEKRPLISRNGFSKDSGVSYRLLNYLLTGERKLTTKTIDKMYPLMVHYGYRDEEPESVDFPVEFITECPEAQKTI